MKCLVVNADDFGFTQDVNAGILRGHVDGIVRSASLMANGPAFDDAVRIAKRHPSLGVGCHLTLVQGESVSRPGTQLPSTLAQLFANSLSTDAARHEFRAQVEALLSRGIRPTHLDTHKHVHLFPPVLDAVALVADEYSISWIRKPFDIPLGMAPNLRTCLSLALRPFRIPFEDRLRRARCRTADHFAGFVATGSLAAPWLASLLASLPEGVVEFMCHPGICGPELLRAETRLKQSRERELEALCSPLVKRVVAENGVQVLSYGQLPT